MARLKKLVTQLMSRTQLLSSLLKEAGISVPAEPALEKISPLKWSNKINVDDIDKYFDKVEESKRQLHIGCYCSSYDTTNRVSNN